jgi:hypothetical protein
MAANPLLGATDVARVVKESASSADAWTPELGYGVIDVAAAVALAQGTKPSAAGAGLHLSAHVARKRVTLTATLSSRLALVSSAGRYIAFERNEHGAWKRLVIVRTDAAGRAQAGFAKPTKAVKLRARWIGAPDLAAAASGALTLR